MSIFHYPVFQPQLNNGAPIYDPGVPRGNSQLADGVHSIPWPWLTGYLKITPGWTGAYAGPPISPRNEDVVNGLNRYTGIIAGVYKG